jgi:hypothetical protein
MPKISACAQGRPRIGATIGWITSAKATIISPPQRQYRFGPQRAGRGGGPGRSQQAPAGQGRPSVHGGYPSGSIMPRSWHGRAAGSLSPGLRQRGCEFDPCRFRVRSGNLRPPCEPSPSDNAPENAARRLAPRDLV